MLKKILLGIIIAAIIAGGVYWYNYTEEINLPISNGINAIPSNAAIVFESKQSKNTWGKLSKNSIMWEALLGTETFSKLNYQGHYIDSLLSCNPAIYKLLDNHSFFISAHVSGANTFDFLYVYSLPNLNYKSTIEEFAKKINNNIEPFLREYDDLNIETIYPKHKDSLSFAISKGILMISSKQTLVEDAIRQLKSGVSLANDRNFSKVINTAGKNVDANIYVNYKTFPAILSNFVCPILKNKTNAISNFADFSGWDVTIKPDALMLSGFTQANDSSISYLNLFSKQKPQEIELTKVIPSKTSLLMFFGISNMKIFQRDYKNYLSSKLRLQAYNQYIEGLNKAYQVDLERSVLGWIDNEIALVVTEPSTVDLTSNSYAVIHADNIQDATNSLTSLVDAIAQKNKLKVDTSIFREHVITHLLLPELLPKLIGWQFDKITDNYFTTIGDYVVFANTPLALHSFISDYESNKTLSNNKNYQDFSENISSETNFYIYSAVAHSTKIYSSFLTDELSKAIDTNLEVYKKFEGLGIQFTSNNKMFYSSIYLKYNPVVKEENVLLFESTLDTTVSSKPFLFVNHITKEKEIFIQDDANKIYLINNTGEIIWTKQLSEKIIGDVIQLSVLNSNKLPIVFNTRSYIYMFDSNGSDMKGFPIKLKSKSTNALTVVDYDKNKDYRIFVASENKKITCFKSDGKEFIEFKFDKTANQVNLPIQYFKSNNKDNLCAIDSKGKVYIMDREGGIRFKIKELLPPNLKCFYVQAEKAYSKTYLVASDTIGNVIKLSMFGNKQSVKFQNFDSSPLFEYKDLNNDQIMEYVFLSKNELNVFSQDKSLLFKYEFKSAIKKTLLFFLFPDGKSKIGVVSEGANELYLFNENGSMYDGFPVNGKTNFSIGSLNNDGSYNIITGGADKSIYVYQLQ